jgi:hypothetical protein
VIEEQLRVEHLEQQIDLGLGGGFCLFGYFFCMFSLGFRGVSWHFAIWQNPVFDDDRDVEAVFLRLLRLQEVWPESSEQEREWQDQRRSETLFSGLGRSGSELADRKWEPSGTMAGGATPWL